MTARSILRILFSVMTVAASAFIATSAFADVPSSCVEMECCGTSCACGDDSCCNNACGIGGGNGGGGGNEGGGGGGLIGALFDAMFNPPPPDPAEVARRQAEAEAAAARRAAELAEAKADYDVSQARISERESRGRDLYAAWVALQNALHDAHDRAISAEAATKLLTPLPLRSRMPIAAADQASCAAFHSSLALSMGVWHETSAPPMDPVFLDAERIAHEASSPFDRGESIAGCDQMASLALPSVPAGATSPPGDAKAQAAFVAHAVGDLAPAAQTLAEAQRKFDAAEAAYRSAKADREKADLVRAAEQDRLDKDRNDRDGKLREDEAKRKQAEAEAKKGEPPAWRKAHLKQDEIDAFTLLARNAAEAKVREEDDRQKQIAAQAAQKAFAEKAKQEKAEQDAKEKAAQLQLEAEQRARDAQQAKLDQEEQAAGKATENLAEKGKLKPRPVIVYPSRPRPVRHRRDP